MYIPRDGRIAVETARKEGRSIRKRIKLVNFLIFYVKPTMALLLMCGKCVMNCKCAFFTCFCMFTNLLPLN
jgi:hypothetical protein